MQIMMLTMVMYSVLAGGQSTQNPSKEIQSNPLADTMPSIPQSFLDEIDAQNENQGSHNHDRYSN
jgi:hypothetical protein